MLNPLDREHKKARNLFRILGLVFLIAGISLATIAILNMQNDLFLLGFIGLPLIFVETVCFVFGYMGAISRYRANESTPIASDTVNFMVDKTK